MNPKTNTVYVTSNLNNSVYVKDGGANTVTHDVLLSKNLTAKQKDNTAENLESDRIVPVEVGGSPTDITVRSRKQYDLCIYP